MQMAANMNSATALDQDHRASATIRNYGSDGNGDAPIAELSPQSENLSVMRPRLSSIRLLGTNIQSSITDILNATRFNSVVPLPPSPRPASGVGGGGGGQGGRMRIPSIWIPGDSSSIAKNNSNGNSSRSRRQSSILLERRNDRDREHHDQHRGGSDNNSAVGVTLDASLHAAIKQSLEQVEVLDQLVNLMTSSPDRKAFRNALMKKE
eukprot:gene5265-10534_t